MAGAAHIATARPIHPFFSSSSSTIPRQASSRVADGLTLPQGPTSLTQR